MWKGGFGPVLAVGFSRRSSIASQSNRDYSQKTRIMREIHAPQVGSWTQSANLENNWDEEA
jgi:hypothetical protein